MKYEDFLKETTSIVQNLSDQGKVTEILTRLGDTYKNLFEAHQALSTEKEGMGQTIQSLKEQNMNLFLRTAQPTPDPILVGTDKPLTYDALITELGGN
jgi:hypothetical protein